MSPSTQALRSGVMNGLISFGLAERPTSIAPWKLLYIIEGTITFAFGLIAIFILPNSPATTRIFNDEEREFGEASVLLVW